MPEPQAVLRLLHILLAIVAVGANLTYALWLRQAERDPAHLAYTIRGIRWIDRHVANPAYALLLLTGLRSRWPAASRSRGAGSSRRSRSTSAPRPSASSFSVRSYAASSPPSSAAVPSRRPRWSWASSRSWC